MNTALSTTISIVFLTVLIFGCNNQNRTYMQYYMIDSIEELKSEIVRAFNENNPSIINNLTNKDGMNSNWANEQLREKSKRLTEIFKTFKIVDVEIKSSEVYTPPVDISSGIWKGKGYVSNYKEKWWAVIHAEEKDTDPGEEPGILELYFPVIEIDGKFGFSGVVSAEKPTVRTSEISINHTQSVGAAKGNNAIIFGPSDGQDYTVSLGGDEQILMKWIPSGTFMLGSTAEEREWAVGNVGQSNMGWLGYEGASPRRCHIDNGFWIGQTEVTVGQWKEFIDNTDYKTDAERLGMTWGWGSNVLWQLVKNKSWRDPNWYGVTVCDDYPAVCISWNDARVFCYWLTKKERKAGRLPDNLEYRLPGEAEWEYAARGGRGRTRFWWGNSLEDGEGRLNGASNDDLGYKDHCWFLRYGWSDGYAWAAPVDSYGVKGRNDFGLADMLGNVSELCYDWYDDDGAQTRIINFRSAKDYYHYRVCRGGSFDYEPGRLRCAYRGKSLPTDSASNRGFRVCLGAVVE